MTSLSNQLPDLISPETEFRRLLNSCRHHLEKYEARRSDNFSPNKSSNVKLDYSRLSKYADALQDYLILFKGYKDQDKFDAEVFHEYESQVKAIIKSIPKKDLQSTDPLLYSSFLGSGSNSSKLRNLPRENKMNPLNISISKEVSKSALNTDSLVSDSVKQPIILQPGALPIFPGASSATQSTLNLPASVPPPPIFKPKVFVPNVKRPLAATSTNDVFAATTTDNINRNAALPSPLPDSSLDPLKSSHWIQSATEKHNALTNDLVTLASQLKSNTLQIKSTLTLRGALLDKVDESLDKSLQRTKANTQRATAHRHRNGSGCFFVTVVLLFTVVVFCCMVFYIKATSIATGVSKPFTAVIQTVGNGTVMIRNVVMTLLKLGMKMTHLIAGRGGKGGRMGGEIDVEEHQIGGWAHHGEEF